MASIQERLDRMINGTGAMRNGAGGSVMERLDRMINYEPPEPANRPGGNTVFSWPSQERRAPELPGFVKPQGSGAKTVESVLGRFSNRGTIDAIKSPESWKSAGDAELGLKSWSGELEALEQNITKKREAISSAEERLRQEAASGGAGEGYEALLSEYRKNIDEYKSYVGDYERVREKYTAGVKRYRDILSGGMARAEAAAAEARRLEAENSRLQQQADLIRAYDTSGLDLSGTYAEPMEAEIRRNARRIRELRAEESRSKMQYYSSLELMEDYENLARPADVKGDTAYEYINDLNGARYRNEHTRDPGGEAVALRRYQYLTDDERKIYNYLYASQGREAAARFLEDIGPALTQRQGEAQYDELGTLGKALYWIPAGLDQFGTGVRQLFSAEAEPVSSTQVTSALIQQEAQSKGVGWLYELGTTLANMAPSILLSYATAGALGAAGAGAGAVKTISGLAGSAAMGASAGGNAYTDALNKGYTKEAARNYAALIGASEGGLQYLLGGISALGGFSSETIARKIAGIDNALLRIAATAGSRMIPEGVEEGLQELLDPAFASLILNEQYSVEWENVATAFMLGALSAGILEGADIVRSGKAAADIPDLSSESGYLGEQGRDWFAGLASIEDVERRYAELAGNYHQDLPGGDAAVMADINRQHTMQQAWYRGREAAGTADESTAVNTNPAEHTPAEQKLIEDYQSAVDDKLVQFVNDAVSNRGANNGRYELSPVSDRAADDIQRITGVDTHGNRTVIEQRIAEHIYNEHGPNGTTDHSMRDLNDIGRIQWVLDNYDDVADGGHTDAYVTNRGNGRTGRARTVVFSKAVNGTYYVVEAAPNAKSRTNYIVSAYMTKKKPTETKTADAEAPAFTASPDSMSSVGISSIPSSDQDVNTVFSEYRSFQEAVQAQLMGEAPNIEGGMTNGRTQETAAGAGVSDGDGGRFSGQRAGVEAGELARGAEQAARPTQQVGTALARQARVRALRLERVSSASLGLENGTEARSLQVIPEAAYDDELRAVSADVYRRTGQRVTFVAGNIQVRAVGKTRAVRGVWTPGSIYVQADNAGYSAAQIAAHEVYHDLAANTPGLDADVKQRIIERYGEDEFRRVAQVYIERLRGVYDVPDGAEHDPALMDKYFASILQEIYADAYAGINAFGAHAERFADPTRETVKERTGIRSRENDDAVRDRTGPPAERYSIGYDRDNRPFVTVEEDILDGVPERDWVSTVKGNLKRKFPNGVTVGNSEIKINQQSMREMTFSRYMKWLYNNYPHLRADKLRATNNADEILQATTDWVDEGLNHPRKDTIAAFARGNVLIRVGGNDYSADVVVGSRKDGSMILYDILNLQPTAITEKETTAVKAKNPSPGTDSSTATISTDRVAENALPVKENVPRNELADSESKDAVQELPKGAAENGSLTKATSTASEDIIRDAGESVNARFSIDEDYEREDVPDYFRGNPYWLETEHAAKAAGYPEIDGVQIMPYKTWVRSKEQGNYGFVVGLAPRDRLVVSFWNKDSGKRAVVPLEQTDIEPVQGAYQMEQNELASLLESEPEAVERMELSPEDEAEYQRWLTEKYGFKAGVRANTALLALPKKAQTEYKRSVSRLVNDLGKSLGVPYHAGRSELRPIAEQIADEYFREGTVSEESGAELFEEAYANGIIRDDEFYRENKPILDYLRTTPIRVSETVKSDIADFNDWRKRQFGRLRISEDGRGVDQVYGELSEMAPGFFPEDITNPTDQLERIADVADSIRISERTLDEYYGPDAAEYKRWAYDEFKQQIGRAYESLRTVRQIALEQDAKRAELERLLEIAETGPTEGELDRVKRLWDEGKKARRAYERAVRRNLLSDRDRQLLGQLMRGEISAEDIPSTANRAGIAEIYAAKREYEAFAGALKEFNTKRRAALRAQADDILAGASRMKDKRRGASYMRETQERNARYVFDGPTAEKIIETYFTPVHKNEARRTVYKTQLRDRVRELDLDRKARKGDAVSEAAAVQIYGEALDNISMIEEQLKRGGSDWRNGHSLSEWRALVDDLWAKSPGLDKEKITAAVEEFRKIYDELFSLMNQVRIRNGYEPVDYRHGYFPHFDDAKGESLLGRAFKAANMKDVPLKDRLAALVGKGLDVNTEVNALPTSISGLTHTFKPGIRWVGNIMQRQGFDTTFDAVQGFDRYIEGVSDVIYHTDDIQRLRALASQIRYRTSEPGIQAQVDEIRADSRLTDEQKDEAVRKKQEEGRYELSNYVNNIEEYTNLLANKHSAADRGIEFFAGRDFYNFSKALENRVAANMVAVNPGSWLTNFIPISQAWAEVSAGDILTSMRDTLSAIVKDDGFKTKSDFLTNRIGSDPLVLSWTQDASKVLTKPMEWIDMFTSETVVRARYNSNLKLGMSETAAMEEADSFAASLIADRSKGALPTIFESRNPFTKLFTQFQVEVNNQLSYLYRDLPRNLKERGKKSLAVALLKFMLGAWLYDELYEAIVGRRPALDPLNMLNELSGDLFGYALPNTIELAVDMITGNDVSLATERTDAATALANFGKELGGQLPFIGGPVFDGGRLPIQSAFKDPLAYLLLPFGGGQLSKFVNGVNAVAEGGVYGEDAEGNPTLKYPVERNVKDALTAMVFGTTSTKGGQEWIDRGFGGFSAKQTAAYAALLGGGVDAYDAFDVVMDIKGTEKTETQSANDIKREKISALDISDELKATLYSNLITDDYDEAIDDMLRRSVDWDGIMGVVTNSKYGVERYNKLVDAGVSPGNAARITEALYSLEPEDGKKSVSQVQQYGAIDKLDGLTDEEKLAAIGTIMGTDATTESGNPSQYSKLTDAIESGLSLTDALEQRENGTLDDYLEFYSAGMKSDAAVDAAETLDAMPEDASTVERYLAIAEMPLSERDKDAALSAIMSDSAYEKYQAARSKGIDTYEYVAFLRAISDFSGDGKQQRVWDYINSLPLSTAQKDQLHYAAGYKESSLAKTPWH